MELIPQNTNIQFIKNRYYFYAFSVALLCLAVWAWFQRGDEKFGVDFAGGAEVVLQFNEPVNIHELRSAIEKAGIAGATVQSFTGENQFSVRVKTEEGQRVEEKIKEVAGNIKPSGFSVIKQEFVGPIIGEQIRRDGLIAFLIALVGVLVYLWIRFDLSYSIAAVIALFHDAIIVVGIYLLVGYELNAATLAAVLTLIGYSVNDTVIVYDRIRENFSKALKSGGVKKAGPKFKDIGDIMNVSLNQTLSRTLLTSLTAFFVCLVLWVYGGGAVADMAFILALGIVKGTYSSIFVASALVYEYESRRA